MAYDKFPAVDGVTYAFPPEVMEALEKSAKLKNVAIPMTQIDRNNLAGAELWDGRLVINTDTDRVNRYDLGSTSWKSLAEDSEIAASRILTGMRNRALNGDFRVNQLAYVSGTVLVGTYGFDQWYDSFTGTALTFTPSPNGQLLTISDPGSIAQHIERANMPAGRYVVSHAGDAYGTLYKIGGTIRTVSQCPFVVDIDGTGDYILVFASFGGATKTVGKVQVEQIGPAGTFADATPFEFRPYGLELALCQRYFHRLKPLAASGRFGHGQATSTVTSRSLLRISPDMRVPPTATFSAAAGFQVTNAGGTAQAVTVMQLIDSEVDLAYVAATTVGIVAGNATMLLSAAGAATIDLSARIP